MNMVTSMQLGADKSQSYYAHKRWQSGTYHEDWLFDVRLNNSRLTISSD